MNNHDAVEFAKNEDSKDWKTEVQISDEYNDYKERFIEMLSSFNLCGTDTSAKLRP